MKVEIKHSADSFENPMVNRLKAIVTEVIQAFPVFLVDVDVRGRTGSRVIDIYLDGDDGVNISTLAKISRKVSFLLDLEPDLVKGAFRLNVSTPGIDRPLKLPRQFVKNVGRKLKVEIDSEENAVDVVLGTLTNANEKGVSLQMSKASDRFIPYQQIRTASVQLPW